MQASHTGGFRPQPCFPQNTTELYDTRQNSTNSGRPPDGDNCCVFFPLPEEYLTGLGGYYVAFLHQGESQVTRTELSPIKKQFKVQFLAWQMVWQPTAGTAVRSRPSTESVATK